MTGYDRRVLDPDEKRIDELASKLEEAREVIAGHEVLFREIGKRDGRTSRKFQRLRKKLKDANGLIRRLRVELQNQQDSPIFEQVAKLRLANASLEIRLHDAHRQISDLETGR